MDKTKYMKSRFLVFVVVFSVQCGLAQNIDAKELEDYQNKVMFEKLDLTENQISLVKEHNSKYSKKQAELMNREGSMFGKIGEVRRMKKARNEELEKILSADQFEVFEDDIEPMISKHMRKKMTE